MRECEYITIDLPNAYENNMGLWGTLDLDLPMPMVRRHHHFCRLLECHFWEVAQVDG
jgi:hypothetical protein